MSWARGAAVCGESHATPYLFVLPAFLIMAAVVFYPLLYNFDLSFQNMDLYHARSPSYIGVDHYREILGSGQFAGLFLKTLIWTVLCVSAHVVLGIAAALLLNTDTPGRTVFRALLILPWAMPQYSTARAWRGMFNYEYGAVNLILGRLGLDPVPWFTDPTAAFMAPVIANVWLGFPFMMVVALGGLQAIPRELYEAAEVDGAGFWTRLWRITLPMLRPVMAPAIALGTIWTFNNLNVIWLVTHGGLPADRTHILVTYVYKAAFTYYRYSYAAAFSVVILFILLALVILYIRVSRLEESTR